MILCFILDHFSSIKTIFDLFNVCMYYEAFIIWIPDYDIDINENKKRRLNRFLDEEYRMLVCSQSVYGKTNTITHMLRNYWCIMTRFILHTKSKPREIQDLKKIVDRWLRRYGNKNTRRDN